MDGRSLARQIRDDVAQRAAKIRDTTGVTPTLATVGVGSSPSSATYARMKRKRCEQAGITAAMVELPIDTPSAQVVAEIRKLAADSSVHGIIVQHPVPRTVDRRAVFEAIPIEKDVDAVSSAALGRAIVGMPAFASCTPKGIMRLLAEYTVDLVGMHAVVLGRSPILGRPMASMLINAHATVTLCHSRTRILADIVRGADLLIAAVGRTRFVQGDWIKAPSAMYSNSFRGEA